jgi:hypothetical protein
MEHIIAVVDGRRSLLEEMANCPSREVRGFVSELFQRFIADDEFLSALDGHVRGEARRKKVLQVMRDIGQQR